LQVCFILEQCSPLSSAAFSSLVPLFVLLFLQVFVETKYAMKVQEEEEEEEEEEMTSRLETNLGSRAEWQLAHNRLIPSHSLAAVSDRHSRRCCSWQALLCLPHYCHPTARSNNATAHRERERGRGRLYQLLAMPA
jgi:hypothetical protein